MYYYIIYNIKFQPTLYGTKIKNPNVTALRRYAVTSPSHSSFSSIPYCPHIHWAALAGMSFVVGITPSSARKDVFWLSHRLKVRMLTPAARANSYLK